MPAMPSWLSSDWTIVIGAPLFVALVGALVGRADIPRWRAARVEETARLLALAPEGSRDHQLLQGQLEHQLARETDRREVRRRAGWLTHVWWVTSLAMTLAGLIARHVWSTVPSWWGYAFMAVGVLGIAIPNGRIGRIEFEVRHERRESSSARPQAAPPAAAKAAASTSPRKPKRRRR